MLPPMVRGRMSFSIARTSSAALAACVWLVACGPAAKPEQANRVSDAEREAMRADAEKEKAAKAKANAGPPRWLRAGPSFPEAFAPFPVPDLQAIEGTWLVPSEVEGQRELWLAEAPQPAPKVEGDRVAKVVVVDRRGREQVHGVTLQSPCAVQVTNEYGRSRPRALWVGGGKLHLSPGGAVAIEGSAATATAAADAASPLRPVLACSGNRAYVFEGEGCKRYSQMLGVWDATDVDCRRDGEALVIDDLRLEPAGAGVWMDAAAATATATAFADRGAAETALSAAPKASAEGEPPESAGTEAGSDGGVATGSETTGT